MLFPKVIFGPLPALPAVWPADSIKGLCARGGFEVDLAWKDKKLTSATSRSRVGGLLKIRLGDRLVEFPTRNGEALQWGPDLNRRQTALS